MITFYIYQQVKGTVIGTSIVLSQRHQERVITFTFLKVCSLQTQQGTATILTRSVISGIPTTLFYLLLRYQRKPKGTGVLPYYLELRVTECLREQVCFYII